jgi:hypothetical protein
MLLVSAVVTVVVIAAAGILLASPAPEPRALEVAADGRAGSDALFLTRTGGETADLGALRVIVTVGDETWYDGPAGDAGVPWALGETRTLGPLSRPLQDGQAAEVSVAQTGPVGRVLTTVRLVPTSPAAASFANGLQVDRLGAGPANTVDLQPTQNFLAYALVDHPDGRKVILSVTAYLPDLSPPVEMHDDGTAGDPLTGDGRFAAHFIIPVNALPGTYPLVVTATDITGGRALNVSWVRILSPTEPEIRFGDFPPATPTPPTVPTPPATPTPPTVPTAPTIPMPPPTPTVPVTPTPPTPPPPPPPPPRPPCFAILPSGGVTPLVDGTVRVQVVGSAITYGKDGPSIPVTAKFTKNGGASFTSLYGGKAVKAGDNQSFAVTAGSVLGVRGAASYSTFHATYDSYVADPHVEVLKDGDAAPDVPAFGRQTALKSFLAPFVRNATMDIQPYQVIVLYEFNPSLASDAADYQDLVMFFDFPSTLCPT